jgi:hypothetical protein
VFCVQRFPMDRFDNVFFPHLPPFAQVCNFFGLSSKIRGSRSPMPSLVRIEHSQGPKCRTWANVLFALDVQSCLQFGDLANCPDCFSVCTQTHTPPAALLSWHLEQVWSNQNALGDPEGWPSKKIVEPQEFGFPQQHYCKITHQR